VVERHAQNRIVTRDVAKDAGQTALIGKYETLIAPIANRVVGTITGDCDRAVIPSGETRMGDVIADAQLEGTRNLGAVAAFMNPGGVRTDLLVTQISGGEQSGQITYGEAFAVQPFGNTMVVLNVTGAQLDTLLEQQWSLSGGVEKVNMLAVSASVKYSFDPTRAIGDRVDAGSITVDGVVVNPAASYRIAANNFLADGGDGFAVLKLGTERVPGPSDLDAFERYLTAHSPLAPPALDRVTRL
jgi:5'-nucleotidase